ncbi:MAG TPA: ABC transporter permease [Acidobacteriaceae bacterium]|jgi:putative ABC transport system permease protein|nr:ABC transporter permease [Acidobacteriaceae bacterium]
MSNLWQDLRYAVRQLRKSLGFSLTAILTLALGIGATTAIFSVVDGVLLRPLPFHDPSRLMALGDSLQGVPGMSGLAGVTAPDIVAYARDTHAFADLGGYQSTGYELSGAGEPAQVNAARLSASIFPTLGVAPLLGRVFTQQEDDQSQQVVVLSYSLWNSRFHGDPNILGKKILLARKPYIVIGVMPRNFEFPLIPGHLNRSELWVPLSLTQSELTQGVDSWDFQMMGRLKPGITAAQAVTDADRVAGEIMRNYPAYMRSLHIYVIVTPLRAETVAQAQPLIHILFLAVFVVLLIACANLAGLLLVRAIRRRRETAVRLALGSSTGTLMRQALLESLVLSVSGGVLGILLAGIALHVSISLLPETLPRIDDIRLNWVVVVFAMLLAIMTGILCALAPAFAAIHTSMNEALKEGGRSGSAGGGHARLRSILVISEVAVALVLLIASGLLLRSFQKMRDVDLGFQPQHIVMASYSLPQQKYTTQASVDAFNRELLRRLQQLPGAESVGLSSSLPMSGGISNNAFIVDGYVQPKGAIVNLADTPLVEGDYFQTMGIPLLRGRFFTESDNATAQLAVVVNHKLAEHYWPGQSPLGKRLRIGTEQLQTPWLTVVGEVADVKSGAPDGDTNEEFYQPVAQTEASIGALGRPDDINGNGMSVALRTALPPEMMENSLRAVFHSLDPQLAITQVQSMEQAVSDTEAPRRFNTTIITVFALVAVLLAILGIYSVIAFSVASRTQEMAIRMALGSPRSGIIGLVLGSGARLAGIGCCIGVVGAIVAARLIRSLLFQVQPFDPLVVICAAVVILLLALVASALPARRAASIDPMQALRSE